MTDRENNLITVVMPVFNAGSFLEDAVISVLGQSWNNLELLIVDDASTDHSLQTAYHFEKQDSRVRVIPLPKNQGVARARNFGIREARGQYIALLDSDDVWLPEKLQTQMNRLRETGADIIYSSYDFIDEQGQSFKRPFIVPAETDYGHMLVKSVISCSTALIRGNLLKEHLFSGEQYHEDFVLWLELLSQRGVKAAGCPEVLAHYRQVRGSRSSDKRNSAQKRWKIYREVLGMNWMKSAWIFFRYAVCAVRKYYF